MRINLYFFLSIVSISFSQITSISGVVKSDRGELLAGTNVFIEGTLLGAATDISGKYTIEKNSIRQNLQNYCHVHWAQDYDKRD
jgi:hypothetical protein